MANIKKYPRTVVNKIIRHNSRLNKTYGNQDIKPELTERNFAFIDKGYAGYKERLQELHVMNRKDVKTLCEWVVTMPEKAYLGPENIVNLNDYQDGERSLEGSNTYEIAAELTSFLCSRYGKENCIQAIVHVDESGKSHLHFTFIPAVEDPKHGGEKVCANDVINRADLASFHADLRDYLNEQDRNGSLKIHRDKAAGGRMDPDGIEWQRKYRAIGFAGQGVKRGIGDLFYTGITKAQGGNRTVREMKQERDQQHTIEHSKEQNVSRWGFTHEVEHEIER